MMAVVMCILIAGTGFAGISARADKEYSNTEIRIAKQLAKFQNNYLKDPDSLVIVSIVKGDMEVDPRLKSYVDSPYSEYRYAVRCKAKNSLGNYVEDYVFFTASLNSWIPDKREYWSAVDVQDGEDISAKTFNDIKTLTKLYYDEKDD